MRDLKELTGYDIITEEKIPEVNGTGYILSHKKTKARVLVIANDDENKVFNIGFLSSMPPLSLGKATAKQRLSFLPLKW